MEDQIKILKDKASKMIKLLEDESFQELIIQGFIKEGILDHAINNSIDSQNTQDQLKARQILHKYIFELINYAETAQK